MTGGLLPPEIRVTQLSDEQPGPSFFIRFREPVASLTHNWNYVHSREFALARRLLRETDLLFVQRAFSEESCWLMQSARRAGISVLYETDDLLLQLAPQTHFRLSERQKRAVVRMLQSADGVTCSTRPLAQALSAYNDRVTVLENYAIPFTGARDFAARSRSPHLAIVNTDYFKLTDQKAGLFGALRHAVKKLAYRITFFGNIDPIVSEFHSTFPDQVSVVDSFIPSRRRFLETLTDRGINVALVPLEVATYHDFKSDIKFMDFASIAVPAIYNHPVIYKCVEHGVNGFMSDGTEQGWLKGLEFFASAERRRDCGDRAYDAAHARTLENYSTELREVILKHAGQKTTTPHAVGSLAAGAMGV